MVRSGPPARLALAARRRLPLRLRRRGEVRHRLSRGKDSCHHHLVGQGQLSPPPRGLWAADNAAITVVLRCEIFCVEMLLR